MDWARYISVIGFLLIIFIAEYIFPHFSGRSRRIKHAGVNILFALLNSLIGFLFIGITINALKSGPLIMQRLGLSFLVTGLLTFFLFDLWMYIWHRMNHEIFFLWRFHRMHHTDTEMDSTTALRFHPGEIFMSNILNLVLICTLGLIMPVLALHRVLLNLSIIFHHSNVALPEKIDRVFRAVIVTPNMHRVHHSQVRQETDSNYSSLFSFWDRILKTFRKREDTRTIDYGIKGMSGNRFCSIPGMIKTPLY